MSRGVEGGGRVGGDLPEQLATFLAIFPIDFDFGKLAGKVTNGTHVTAECCKHCVSQFSST